jgi:ABC-type sugar transport system substrate-binding protein
MMHRTWFGKRFGWLLVLLALTMVGPPLAAAQSSPVATPGGDRYTQAEVTAATGDHAVMSVYAVPKHLKKKYTLAFINPGQNIPFFHDWSLGMNAAAKFYGVNFIETDVQLHEDQIITQFETIAIRNPDVVGTLTSSGAALKARADQAGIPLLPIDIEIPDNPYYMGVPNEQVGTTGGELLGKAAKAKLADDWKGRNLVYVGLGESTCEPCTIRVEAGLKAVRETLDIPDSNVVMLDTGGLTDQSQTATTDMLTAHPNDVFIMLGLNDESGVGALQAVKAAGRADDALLVSLGADELGRDTMRNDTNGVYVAMVDFNPWAEGWCWVEAAIAIAEGEKFSAYQTSRIVTPENIDKLFPNDKK